MTALTDRLAAARSVADAVCYEGYLLYPYRASSPKNQARWQFGVLVPRAFAEEDGSERCSMRSECLVRTDRSSVLGVRVRCLQVQRRTVETATPDGFALTESLDVGGVRYINWEEGVERVVDLHPLQLRTRPTPEQPPSWAEPFSFPAGVDTEEVHDGAGRVVGRLVRHRETVEGVVRVTVAGVDGAPGGPPAASLSKVTIVVENRTEWARPGARRREVMGASMVAVHIMMFVDRGRFVSLLDPPPDAAVAAPGCRNDGAFPVLIGADDVMLSSAIILYDHPAVAPQSPGDLYDATEIEEILALRVLTLTDEEKAEARVTDERAAAIIDRCDDMAPEAWDRLHATMGPTPPDLPVGPGHPVLPENPELSENPVHWWDPAADAAFDPWTESLSVAGVEITKGSPVRLRPSHRADAQDIFLRGMTATVAGVFTDVDGSQHLAVTVNDDPATEALAWQRRYLFFHPDEVEPLRPDEGPS